MSDHLKYNLLTILLIITSLFGYIEWGGDNKAFLFEIELEILPKLITDPLSALHPFTILPFAGQLILLITLFLKQQNKILSYIGIAGIGLLLGLMFVIGIIGLHFKTVASSTPFLVIAIVTIVVLRKIGKGR